MPLNKLDNFIKNTDGRILYVSPSDLDSTDSIDNQGNSLARPFKTIQRALLEAARFSYVKGDDNDITEKTTILLLPGEHLIDNRPGFRLYNDGGTAKVVAPDQSISGSNPTASSALGLSLSSNFDLTQVDNILYKFNSIYGGVIVPRGVSIVGLDLRKTKVRPKYIPNPTDPSAAKSAIFRVTGACYLWQFSFFDARETELAYTNPTDFTDTAKPTFSHHKLTCFEYVDGVNKYGNTGLTDLDMYYAKLSNAYGTSAGTREIDQKYPADAGGFAKQRPEWEIVGAFDSDVIPLASISISSSGSNLVTVTTSVPHEFNEGTPIKIRNVVPTDYNISTKVQTVLSDTRFTYLIPNARRDLDLNGSISSATVVIETDTVSGASPYIFNISLRSVWGMNGMHADGSKASGFRSMVVAQFTGVSLQKDDRAFVKYFQDSRKYIGISVSKVTGAELSSRSSSTDPGTAYHLDASAIYRKGWETSHIKASNDSFIQVVSVFAIGFAKHFDGESGADYSITNSNSNFGQISLNGDGFRAKAFDKDNNLFLTNVVTPKAITGTPKTVDWQAIDVGVTTSPTFNPSGNKIYLFGFNSQDNVPPILTQGYRIGGAVNDKLYATINKVEYSADIVMSDGVTSSAKEYTVSQVSNNRFVLSGAHTLENAEKVTIQSIDGDLPENITEHTVYYVITSAINATRTDGVTLQSTEVQLATSQADASLGVPVTVYGGIKLKILSRVHDKQAGDLGHPVQFDNTKKQWYINVKSTNNTIYSTLSSLGVGGYQIRTDASYIKRIPDTRSLDERLYKLRVVIPKELLGAKAPEPGFIIQESSFTGVRNDTDFILPTTRNLTSSDYNYNKNPRFISSCSRSAAVNGVYTVTVETEKPHNLNVGNDVKIYGIKDSILNPFGEFGYGYNGKYDVKSVVNDMSFTYQITAGVSTFPTFPTTKNTSWPRFERNDVKDNFIIYRSVVISDYIEGQKDGVYHLFALNASNTVEEEFTDSTYTQNVVDLYPQLDRDNINDNPPSTKSYALRTPLGKVVTNDQKHSLTRETTDKFAKSFGFGLGITTVTSSTGIATLSFDRNHGFGGIISVGITTGGVGYQTGTYYNVKVLKDGTITNTWQGATATVVVNSSTNVSSVQITNPGSGYTTGTYQLDESVIGNNGAQTNVSLDLTAGGISTSLGQVIQTTGIGTTADGYYRITSIPAPNRIAIARTAGDPTPLVGQYLLLTGLSASITSLASNASAGITTFTCSSAHGLVAGNKIRLLDSSNNNLGDYFVNSRVGVNTFNVLTSGITTASFALKHGFASNDGSSDSTLENLSTRSTFILDKEVAYVVGFTDDTRIRISVPSPGIGTTSRFSYGSYIQIDDEIMRVASNTLGGTNNDEITVLRGSLATRKVSHDVGSIIRKIDPVPLEIRRPTTMRASGHTFEYLGYGPGNYSTGLPQVQIRSLSEREEFLAQSQEKRGGIVVYTGMNNRGDSFQGNSKSSAASGVIVTYDIPTPTITGENASRLSVVFDEVTVKERIVVEGGSSNTVLSQFDGPLNINGETNFTAPVLIRHLLTVRDETDSTSTTSGALVVTGGVGIAKNVSIGGTLTANNLVANNVTFGVINSTSTNQAVGFGSTSSALSVAGGAAISKNLIINQNVGIGTTNPTKRFHIFAAHTHIANDEIGLIENISVGEPASLSFMARSDNGSIGNKGSIYFDAGADGTTADNKLQLTARHQDTTDPTITITGGGNVGVGSTSPQEQLDVKGGLGFVRIGEVYAGYNGITLNGSTSDNDYNFISRVGDTDLYINRPSTKNIRFRMNNVDQMILDGDGDLGIGTATINNKLHVQGTALIAGSLAADSLSLTHTTTGIGVGDIGSNGGGDGIFGIYNTTNSGSIAFNVKDSGGTYNDILTMTSSVATVDGELRVTGDITAFYTSDQRLKDNITPINDPLAKVISISGNTYTWNEQSGKEGNDVGVIAQEIQAVLPEAVIERDNGYLAVDYHKLVPLLIESIKELTAKVEKLEQKLQDK
jgi:hypothetical protein